MVNLGNGGINKLARNLRQSFLLSQLFKEAFQIAFKILNIMCGAFVVIAQTLLQIEIHITLIPSQRKQLMGCGGTVQNTVFHLIHIIGVNQISTIEVSVPDMIAQHFTSISIVPVKFSLFTYIIGNSSPEQSFANIKAVIQLGHILALSKGIRQITDHHTVTQFSCIAYPIPQISRKAFSTDDQFIALGIPGSDHQLSFFYQLAYHRLFFRHHMQIFLQNTHLRIQ